MDPNIRIAKVEVPDSEAKLAVTIIGEIRRIVGASSSEHTVDACQRAVDMSREKGAAALNELAREMHSIAASKGFHDSPILVGNACANLHAEVSELFEAYRNNALDHLCDKSYKMDHAGLEPLTCREEELADILIRALDTAHEWGVDIDRAVRIKAAYNGTRPRMNGGKAV